MKKHLAVLATACLPWLSPAPAAAYQIDCAILLCLSGGFPPSEPCARAKAEMIRRITPWPIEPPLQIWRCSMRASFAPEQAGEPLARLYDAASREQSVPQSALEVRDPSRPIEIDALLHQIAEGDYDDANGRADVDISGAEFDFVRSIRVYSVERARQWWGGRDGECKRMERVRVGRYGLQGEFNWAGSSVQALPKAFKGVAGWGDRSCRSVSIRAVFIDWHDREGNYGFEQVDY